MKHLVYIFILLTLMPLSSAAQDADLILSKAAIAYEAANGLKASFAATVKPGKGQPPQQMEGTIQMRGNKFALTTNGMHTWYDGTTQWAYVAQTGEVNISTPSGDELQFVNPMTLLRTYRKNYTAGYIGQSTADDGKMADDLLLTAKGKSDISRIELQVSRTTMLPARITVVMKNGLQSTIRISRLQIGMKQPDTSFTFDRTAYPDAVEVDLR